MLNCVLWGCQAKRVKSQRLQPIYKKRLGHTGTRVGQREIRSIPSDLSRTQADFEIAQEL